MRIKFTQTGSVQFVVHYRSPVAEFEVIDTGPGIQAGDLERIFAPFERGALGVSQPQTGTGLGLTISRLLAGVMGGDIKVTSDGRHRQHLPRQDPAVGSHQSDADRAGRGADLRLSRPAQDDPDHRRRSDPARPPARGADAARLHPAQRARRPRLSRAGAALPARSVPARYLDGRHGRLDGGGNAARERPSPGPHPDGVGERAGGARRAAGAAVPRRLSDEADRYSAGCWRPSASCSRSNGSTRPIRSPLPHWKPETGSRPPVKHVEELIGLGQLGYIRAIQVKLDEIGNDYPEHADFVSQMRSLDRPLRSRSVHGDPEDTAQL